MRKNIIKLIFKVAKEKDAFSQLEKYLNSLSKQDLSENLIQCGVLPEMFEHDSSEEKLWAKFSDIMLAKALNFLDIEAQVLGARSNSADVFGKAKTYTLVGDAKTFRLSRTAKNQKDFKVNALDNWKQDNNYAMLLAPLLQYPTRKSQIYAQAIDKNVTLISYTHLQFLVDFYQNQSLQPIWDVGKKLSKTAKTEHQNSDNYWKSIDEAFVYVVGKQLSDLHLYKELGKEGIVFWEEKITSFQKLSKEEAIKLLIKSEKIEAKIKTIVKAINIK